MAETADDATEGYGEVTDARYADHVAATFTLETSGYGAVLRGLCPRCEHPMTYTVDDVVRAARWWPFGKNEATPPAPVAPAQPAVEHMICTCDATHANRPRDYVFGCGAYWSVSLHS